jgi:hypothetical protein
MAIGTILEVASVDWAMGSSPEVAYDQENVKGEREAKYVNGFQIVLYLFILQNSIKNNIIMQKKKKKKRVLFNRGPKQERQNSPGRNRFLLIGLL